MRERSGHEALGAGIMVLTMALYTANDTIVKLLGKAMPLGAIITYRGVLILVITLALILVLPGHGPGALKWLGSRAVIIRSLWDTAVTILYLTALMHMPIANILAIMNLSPLAIIPLAAWLQGERPGARRVIAVITGFAGALFVVRPGTEGFGLWALAAFLAMLGVAGRDLSTRGIPSGAPALVVALGNVILVQVLGMAMLFFAPYPAPSDAEWMALSACALFLGLAYVLIIVAVRIAPVSKTAVWRYSIVLWGVLAGWLAFGQVPDAPALFGIALILASSLYVSFREWRDREKENPAV